MKNFFKNVAANIVAFFIIAFVCVTSLIFFSIYSVISGSGEVKVKKNSVLVLDAKTILIDSPTEDNPSFFDMNNENSKVLTYDVVNAIRKAKTDDKIAGISFENDNITAGLTQLDDVRAALEDFKKSGKFVLAYGNTVSQGSYYVGSVADQYFLHPAGGIELKGMGAEIVFYKDFFDKYGIGVDVIRHGKYKAAVEPYLRNEISEENKEQMSVLLNDIWAGTAKKIATSRKLDSANFKTVVDSLYGIIPELSLQNKLADKLIQKGEYDTILKAKAKIKDSDKLNKISISKYVESLDEDEFGDQVAVLYASGAIYSGEGYSDIYSKNLITEIRNLKLNKKVKSVVLRINSPGGSANASDEILYELLELKKEKPLVVSFGDYAASGGYYIAMAGDKIYSEPNTLTGSIGVFGVLMNYKEIANKNGLRSDIVSTNANARYYSGMNGLTPSAENMITKSVEQTYKRFVDFVTKNRKKSFEQIDELGGGRVWSGSRAKDNGLVDELGTLEDAIKFAAQKSKLSSYNVSTYPKKMTQIEQFFKKKGEDETISTQFLKSQLGKENFKTYQMLMDPKSKSGLFMEIPYKLSF